MILKIIISVVFFYVGFFIASLWGIGFLINIKFGIPLTLKLKRMKAFKNKIPLIEFTISTIFSFLIIVGSFMIVLSNFFKYRYAFLLGICWILFFGFGRLSANTNNISDYYESTHKHFTDKFKELYTPEDFFGLIAFIFKSTYKIKIKIISNLIIVTLFLYIVGWNHSKRFHREDSFWQTYSPIVIYRGLESFWHQGPKTLMANNNTDSQQNNQQFYLKLFRFSTSIEDDTSYKKLVKIIKDYKNNNVNWQAELSNVDMITTIRLFFKINLQVKKDILTSIKMYFINGNKEFKFSKTYISLESKLKNYTKTDSIKKKIIRDYNQLLKIFDGLQIKNNIGINPIEEKQNKIINTFLNETNNSIKKADTRLKIIFKELVNIDL